VILSSSICAETDRVAVIVKAREPARIPVAIGGEKNDSPHLEFKHRWVNRSNFYLNDKPWGRMFVRTCPYFPFPARVCLNQHHRLAIRMREEDIDFQQSTNAFLKCGNPERLQELADSLTTQDLAALRPEVAGGVHAILHRQGASICGLPTPPVLLLGGVL